MSCTEIIEKVAAYRDEEIVILNHRNDVNTVELCSSVFTSFLIGHSVS